MKWADWKGTYLLIMSDFAFDSKREKEAAAMASFSSHSTNCLTGAIALAAIRERLGTRCIVCGNSQRLEHDIRFLLEHDCKEGNSIIAADAAAARIGRLGIVPDIIVTDMDGEPDAEMKQNSEGSLLILHFHGDNMERAAAISKKLKGRFIVTVQSEPGEGVFNFGGFSDGDRAVLLAEEFGVHEIVLAGFDFSQPFESGYDGSVKLRKLDWARRIIAEAGKRGMALIDAPDCVSGMETNKKVEV